MSWLVQKALQKEDVYLNFVNSIKSDVTKKIYAYNLRLFMEFCDIDKLEDLTGRQNQIIPYLLSLRERKLSLLIMIKCLLISIFCICIPNWNCGTLFTL